MSGIKNEINLGFKSKCFERIPATSANKIRDADSPQVNDGMIVLEEIVPPEQVTEDRTAGGQYDFVGVNLTIMAREGNINMVCILF